MEDYKGKNVLVVGLGRSGLAAARYLAERGATVTVTDVRREPELSLEIESLTGLNIMYCLGSNPASLFAETEIIVLSPGVPLDIDGIAVAKEKGIPVVCELELGIPELSGSIIGITGTNGKSTTTAIVGEIMKEAGKKVWVGGNIGKPLVGEMGEAARADFVVLELSSYQLESTPSLRPHIAVWLNATPDHLDRYRSFDDYVKAKALLGRNQKSGDWIVYNFDDPLVSHKTGAFESRRLPFSVTNRLDIGACYKDETLILTLPVNACQINTSVSQLKGIHNRENIAAACLVCAVCGLGVDEMEGGLAKFRGLPHRLEPVDEIGGVSYYDDSKGTNVGATLMSIRSFESPVVLIAGGLDKNTGYASLKGVVAEKVRSIVAIGEAAERIKEELGDLVEVNICPTMDEAVVLASNKARKGDVVLLSPACASFDMFRDYAHMGEVFVDCVRKIRERKAMGVGGTLRKG